MPNGDRLALKGVRENNLQEIDVTLDHDQLIVVTGVSGSGKSTLAFDTIYAEGGRRYIETFSPYTRQFLDRLHQPDLDAVDGVRPALALEQRNRTTSSRSTVGTVTEINDYLKVLWPHLSQPICPNCHTPVRRYTPIDVCDEAFGLLEHGAESLTLAFSLPVRGEISIESYREVVQSQGFVRFVSAPTGEVKRLSDLVENDLTNDREVLIALDRVSAFSDDRLAFRRRLVPSVMQAYQYGHGALELITFAASRMQRVVLREVPSCTTCGLQIPAPRPSIFSFNSPLGACTTCHGFGKVLDLDPGRCIPNPTKSIDEGAVQCWSSPATRAELRKLKKFCEEEEIATSLPWRELSEKERTRIFYGVGGKKGWRGISGWFEKLKTKRHKMHVRVFLARYRSESTCPDCHGGRLQPEAAIYRVESKTLQDLWQIPFADLLAWFDRLAVEYQSHEIVEIPLEEIRTRLRYLTQIGLGYMTLDRQTKTLSGGEFQRVNLTSILGTRLTNTTLVLDEPTIGLHPRDTQRLIGALEMLRDRGNTLIVVEHEPEVMLAADEILDLGPLSGESGGRIVYQGPVDRIGAAKNSVTADYLSGKLEIARTPASAKPLKKGAKAPPLRHLLIEGATLFNLSDLTVKIPLGKFVVITGVSGSGKSTLVHRCLYDSAKILLGQQSSERAELDEAQLDEYGIGARRLTVKGIRGLDAIDDIIMIDQSPIGKTPRSNPATYTGIWDTVREILAETPRAIELGLGKSAFSFNVDGGRCTRCNGAGYERIEMQFLADVFVECESCGGTRFKDTVLTVNIGGRNVKELLEMSLEECSGFLKGVCDERRYEKLRRLLAPMIDLGLGYLRLGQPLSEVSGGEAQRIKLASYLSAGSEANYLFILDEPTTGLHPYNIQFLLRTFEHLLERGHSIVCVEHNRDLIRSADWLIDLGPDGGANGGRIMLEGEPAKLLSDPAAAEQSLTISELQKSEGIPLEAAKRNRKRAQRVPAGVAVRKKSGASFHPPIEVIGAREHNLKDISVKIPAGQLTVITGVSGSGKSTLAFDILFQEGQRRYIDCLSPYARQYLTHLKRSEVDRVDNIPPTIAVSQKTAPPHGVSTIATTTEIYQFLRLLYSKAGTQRCPKHDLPIQGLSRDGIGQEIFEYAKGKRTFIFAPAVSGRKGFYTDLFQRAARAEILEARVDGKIVRVHEELRLERHKLHWISLLTASFSELRQNDEMLQAAVDQALLLGSGTIEVVTGEKAGEPRVFSTDRVCPKCKRGFRELDPQDFSFRSHRGVCARCGGRGYLGGDEENPSLKKQVCPVCDGARIGEVGRSVTLFDKRIFELARLTAPQLLEAIREFDFPARLAPVVDPILREMRHRLEVIDSVGLGYLSLNRDASTLSGGEAQRLRLARSLGSPLTGICYVLDEPTIGLHPKDHEKLMEILTSLRDRGNTIIVVEHDEETICLADHIVDIGPAGGAGGGEIVAIGTPIELLRSERSQTGAALRKRLVDGIRPSKPAMKHEKFLRIEGARANNLKEVTAEFPLGALTVVCGVSGAGKSSLIHSSLVPAIFDEFEENQKKKTKVEKTYTKLSNHEQLKRYLEVDQSPVGKTSTSCPASYLGIFDDVRKLFAMIPEAQARGFNPSYFSFNSGKGRCSNCEGKGYLKVPMNFLPDALSECEVCDGLRYDTAALEIRFQGLSIGEILKKTMAEAREIFTNHASIRRTLNYVTDLGIGYLTLGQPTSTLSGGEIQRLKLAKELGAREAVDTLYILDEPTIGLHMTDIDRLLGVLHKLIERGNTVIVIEHNLDVISAADYLIEMGPGPGDAGGRIIFSGAPAALQRSKTASPTRDALNSPKSLERIHELSEKEDSSPQRRPFSAELEIAV